jgi:hypothetical protein
VYFLFRSANYLCAAQPVIRNCWLHSWLRNCLAFQGIKGSLPCSRTSYWNPSPVSFIASVLCFLQTILILSYHLTLDPPNGFLPSGFLANIWSSSCVLLYIHLIPLMAREQTVQPYKTVGRIESLSCKGSMSTFQPLNISCFAIYNGVYSKILKFKK